MTSSTGNALGTVTPLLLVAIVGLSVVASGGVVAQTATPSPGDGTGMNATEAADEVHVSEDGEIVLVYHEESAGDVSRTEFGVDVATGLMRAMVETETNTSGASGNLSAVLMPDRVGGQGDLAVNDTGNLTALDLDANLTQTDAESSFDASLVAAVNASTPVQSEASTNGSVTVASDAFRMDAEFASESRTAAPPVPDMASAVRIKGTETGYVLTVDRRRPVEDNASWETRAAANETLTARFNATAAQFGGSSDVTINDYAYQAGQGPDLLDINYTVALSDVKTGIAASVVGQLEASAPANFTAAERAALTDALTNVSVDEIAASQNRTGERNTAEASVRISGYEGAMIDYAEILAGQEATPVTTADVERLRATVNAREAAGLVQTTTWDAVVNNTDTETRIEFTSAYDSTNWSAYVTELENRGAGGSPNVTASLSADLMGGEIVADAQFNVTQSGLLDGATGMASGGTGAADGSQSMELLRALREADLQQARTDMSFGGGNVSVEAGAKFANLSALRNATGSLYGGAPLASVYSEDNGTEAATYVRMGSGVTVDQLEEMGVVDDNTTVVDPSDISQFPSVNTTEAADYLGVQVPGDGDGTPTDTATPTDGDDGRDVISVGQPGFGATVAVLAVLLAGLLAVRRRR